MAMRGTRSLETLVPTWTISASWPEMPCMWVWAATLTVVSDCPQSAGSTRSPICRTGSRSEAKGYNDGQVAAVLGGNWLRHLQNRPTIMTTSDGSNPISELSPESLPRGCASGFGLLVTLVGLLVFLIGARPSLFDLDRSPVVGFVQIAVFLVGLAIICMGGYLGLMSFWNNRERHHPPHLGSRLVATGYVVAVFSGMADVLVSAPRHLRRYPTSVPGRPAGWNR